MEWQDVVEKHWEGVEEAAENALILIKKELHENNLSLQFDDNLKQHLQCRAQNG